MSASIKPTLLPHFDNAIARLTATVVLPTPPLPAPTAITFFTPGTDCRDPSAPTASRTRALICTSTALTPGSCITAARVCSRCISKRISYTPARVSDPSPNRGVMIVLAYLWPLALVPFLLEKHDTEVQWHAKNGIVLMIAELVLLFLYVTVTSIVSLASLGLGVVLSLFLIFAWVGILAVHVVAIL